MCTRSARSATSCSSRRTGSHVYDPRPGSQVVVEVLYATDPQPGKPPPLHLTRLGDTCLPTCSVGRRNRNIAGLARARAAEQSRLCRVIHEDQLAIEAADDATHEPQPDTGELDFPGHSAYYSALLMAIRHSRRADAAAMCTRNRICLPTPRPKTSHKN